MQGHIYLEMFWQAPSNSASAFEYSCIILSFYFHFEQCNDALILVEIYKEFERQILLQ